MTSTLRAAARDGSRRASEPASALTLRTSSDPLAVVSSIGDRGQLAGSPAPHGEALPASLRTQMTSSFGFSFADVRVHAGPEAAHATTSLGARALSAGRDLMFADGEYRPDSLRGRALIAHELAHVVQADRYLGSAHPVRLEPEGGGAEREARRAAARAALGLRAGTLTEAHGGVALTRTSEQVVPLLSYSLTDLAVTEDDERQILELLRVDANLSATVRDLHNAGMLDELLERVDEPANRRELLRLLGERLDAAARTLVEPTLQQGLAGATSESLQLQYNLGRLRVGSGTTFDRAPYADLVTGDAMGPFTGSGATGVIPTDRGYTDLLRGGTSVLDDHTNPLPGSLSDYLDSLTPDQRRRQVELLVRQPIAARGPDSYAGALPSRLQVLYAAASAQRLEWELVAAIILAEQRDQSRVEDARDFIGGAIAGRNTSVGLGQVTVSTARRYDLFADLLGDDTAVPSAALTARRNLSHEHIVRLLASDEFNIVAVARYLRILANDGSRRSSASLPLTQAAFPNMDLAAYASHSSIWPEDNVAVIGMYYTSRPWTDDLRSEGWGEFVREAYLDVKAAGIR